MASFLRRCWSRRRNVAESLLFWSGLGACYEAVARPTGAIIVMYHSVASDAVAPFIDPPNHMPSRVFEWQMEFLARHRKVIALTDLVAMLESGHTPAAGTVCITFDDGYLDNLTVAAPILSRLGLPATVFLATGYVEAAESQWADRVHVAFARRTKHRLRLVSLGLEADLRQGFQRADARRRVHRHLLEALPEQRRVTLQELERQLAPAGDPGPRLSMNWDDVRELRARHPGIAIGGHSCGHTDLRKHGQDILAAEIAGCASDLRRALGEPPQLFAYPYGRCSEVARRLVVEHGWRAALASDGARRIGPDSDRFLLSRIGAPHSFARFRFLTSGANPGALALFGMA